MKPDWKSVLQILSIIPTLVGLVAQTVRVIEQELAGMDGATKLKAALAQIQTFLAAVITDTKLLADLPAIVQPLITAWVAAFNAIGIFRHQTDSTALPPASAPPADGKL